MTIAKSGLLSLWAFVLVGFCPTPMLQDDIAIISSSGHTWPTTSTMVGNVFFAVCPLIYLIGVFLYLLVGKVGGTKKGNGGTRILNTYFNQ